MSNIEEGIEPQKFSKLWHAAHEARRLGISDKGKRREAIIDAVSAHQKEIIDLGTEEANSFPSVAKKDIREESYQEIKTAINKYLDVYVRSKDNVVIDAIHAAAPNSVDISHLLRERGLYYTTDAIIAANRRIVDGLPATNNLETTVEEIRRDGLDGYTGLIARSIGEKTDVTTIIAKKSRRTADQNRYWWKRGDSHIDIHKTSREYSRSAKAAFYQTLRALFLSSNILDDSEKLKKQVLRFSIHAMKNVTGYDVAIAGSKNPADTEVIDRFAIQLQKRLTELGSDARVIIALRDASEDKDHAPDAPAQVANAYSGPASLAAYRKETESQQHPPFGEFNTLQVEIARSIRTNKVKRDIFISAMSDVINSWDQN